MKCRKCKAELPDGSKFCNMCGCRVASAGRKPKTRGNGTGSVYRRGNKWMCAIITGYTMDADNKLHKRTKTKGGFKTKTEALGYLPKLRLESERKPRSKTFAQLYEAWLPTHRAGKDTLKCYKAAYKYFEPVHYLNIDDIDIDDLQDCVDECPKGRRTKENMKALCGLMYKYAIPRYLASLELGHYLVVSGERRSKAALPDDALEKLRAHTGNVFGASYVLCQCYLGYRPSEFVALDATMYNPTEKAFVHGAKTEAGIGRTVTVSPKIQQYIDPLLTNKASGAVFTDPDGKAYTVSRYRELFYSVLDACGIDNPIIERDGKRFYTYTPHSCRHTFATLMKRVNGSDKDKLELIGHTSTEMLRHYQDVNFADLRKITDAL